MTRIRPAAWLVAAGRAVPGLAVAGYALLVHASPQYYWTQIDTAAYRDGGIAVPEPAARCSTRWSSGAAKLPFTYTPFAALLFAAGSGASFATWQAGMAVAWHDRAAAGGGVPVPGTRRAACSVTWPGRRRRLVIAAAGLWPRTWSAMTLFFGQINLVLLALVVGDLALPDRFKGKGIGIGLAVAGIKSHAVDLLFPTLAVHAAGKGRGGFSALTFAVTVGLGFASAAARRLRGLLGREDHPAGQQNPSTWTTSPLTASYFCACTPRRASTAHARTGWSRRSSSASPGLATSILRR